MHFKNLAYVLLFSLFLSACSQPASQTPLRIGTNSWIGYEPLYLAQHLKLMPEQPLTLQRMNNATEVRAAFERGELDAAGLTLDEAMHLLEKDVPFRVATLLNISDGADKLLARPEIHSIQDLKGKAVAFENTAVGALLLSSALASVGMSLDDIKLVPATADQHYDLYLTGQIDALVTFAPHATRLTRRGAKLLFDSTQMGDARIVDVLIVTPHVAEQRKAELDRLLKSAQTAMDLLVKQNAEAIAFAGTNLKLPPSEWPGLLDGIALGNARFHHDYLKGGKLETTMLELDAVMTRNGLLTHSVRDKIGPHLFVQ